MGDYAVTYEKKGGGRKIITNLSKSEAKKLVKSMKNINNAKKPVLKPDYPNPRISKVV